jgi:hypothetical protein
LHDVVPMPPSILTKEDDGLIVVTSRRPDIARP